MGVHRYDWKRPGPVQHQGDAAVESIRVFSAGAHDARVQDGRLSAAKRDVSRCDASVRCCTEEATRREAGHVRPKAAFELASELVWVLACEWTFCSIASIPGNRPRNCRLKSDCPF